MLGIPQPVLKNPARVGEGKSQAGGKAQEGQRLLLRDVAWLGLAALCKARTAAAQPQGPRGEGAQGISLPASWLLWSAAQDAHQLSCFCRAAASEAARHGTARSSSHPAGLAAALKQGSEL